MILKIFSPLFGNLNFFYYIYGMNSIVYKPLITRGDLSDNITSGLNISNDSSSPTFKYIGYKPQYNWRDQSESTASSTETNAISSTEDSQQIEWENPSTIDWETPSTVASSVTETKNSATSSPAVTSRVQHVFKTPDINPGEMQEFLDVLADNGIAVRITSGARPGSKTASGRTSWHSQGRALDITPVSGTTREDFNKLKDQILNAPAVIKYMQDHNIGILDETLNETLQKTEGSGWHFHIGPDQSALKGLQAWLNDTNHLAKQGMKFPIFAKQGTKLPVILAKNGTTSSRKQQKLYNRVTERLVQQAHNQNISPVTGLKYEEPLQPLTQEIMSFVPGTGDIIEAGNIINNTVSGNLGSALLGASLFVIPGNVPTIIKGIFKPSKELNLSKRFKTGAKERVGYNNKVNNIPTEDYIQNYQAWETNQPSSYNPLFDKILLDENLPEFRKNEVLEHELIHQLDNIGINDPIRYSGERDFIKENTLTDSYWNKPKRLGHPNSEIAPRLVQIKNFLNITDGKKKLTGSEWKKGFEDYIKAGLDDNNIEELYNAISDWDKLAEWAHKYVPAIIPIGVLPSLTNINENEDNRKMY